MQRMIACSSSASFLSSMVLGLMLLLNYACGTKQPKVEDPTLLNPQLSKAHLNLTSNCAQCHEPDREAPNVDKETVVHGLGADCADCHSFPLFAKIKPIVVAHNPMPKICSGCHSVEKEKDNPKVHAPFGECATCHTFPLWSKIGAAKP